MAGTCGEPASAQLQADVQVAWTHDYTTVPYGETCSPGGSTIGGGYCTIHIHLPGSYPIASITSLVATAAECAVHGDDTVTFGGPFASGPCPPGCSQSPYTNHWNILWPISSRHNMPHTIHVEGTCSSYPPFGTSYTFQGDATFTLANLIVTPKEPVNPEPIRWHGDPQNPVPLRAKVSSAYKAQQAVQLRIYDSDQALVKTIETTPTSGPGESELEFEWNGSQDPPREGVAPKGIYLFRWEIGGPGPTMDYDQDKWRSHGEDAGSPFYMTPATTANAQPVHFAGLAGGSVNLDVTYALSEKGTLDGSVLPLYAPDLELRRTCPLFAADIEAGNHSRGGDNVPARATPTTGEVAQFGTYTALVCIPDDRSGQDRKHRHRYALQLGREIAYRTAATTHPVGDGQDVPIFKGRSETGTPCPVVIRGTVEGEQAVAPLLTYAFTHSERVGDEWQSATEPIPEAQLQDPILEWDAGAGLWRYQAIWNQQLDRTSVTDPEEQYHVGARVLSDPNQQGQDQEFRVLSMATPAAGPVTSDYTEDVRQGWVTTRSTSASGNTLTLAYLSSGPHLAVDYGGAAGATINAAEYGAVVQGDEWQLYTGKAIPDAIVDAIWARALNWMQENGHAGQDPWQYLRVEFTFENACNNANTRGPNRIVEHGPVNLVLTAPAADDPYERQPVNSVYCHVATQPDGETPLVPPDKNTTVNVSTKIAEVGAWNDGTLLLMRGYFSCDRTTLFLRVIATGTPVGLPWTNVYTYWPSLNGTHLHFEVRHDPQDPPGGLREKGERDPHKWIGIGYGGNK